MKVKSMKKALSLLCTSAMLAGSFAVVNFDTVEAAAYVWNPNTSQSGYPKVPVANLQATADSELTEAEESTSTGGSFPGTGKVANIVDGVVTSFYHSDYRGSEPKVQYSNGTLTGNNTVTISFKDNQPQDVKGITYLPRQDALANGAFSQFSVAVQKGTSAEFENVTVNGQNDVTLTYTEANWNNNNTTRAEREVLFDTVQEGVTAIKITVTHSAAYSGGTANQYMCGAEISVLTSYIDEYDVSNYITDEGVRTAPTRLGKLFAGWYTDATYSTPYLETTGKAYAKFVEANTLKAGAQTLANTDSFSSKSTLRFVSTVDSLDHKEVGFKITLNGKVKKVATTKVYEKLLAVKDGGDANNGGVIDQLPTLFSKDSKYFFAYNLYNIPANTFDTNFTVVPYWITADGTEVTGIQKVTSINKQLREFHLGNIEYAADHASVTKAPGWTRFDLGNNLDDMLAKPENACLKLTKKAGNWTIYRDGYPKATFLKKVEVLDGTADKEYGAEFTFNGTGAVVLCQGFGNSGSMDIELLDSTGNPVAGKKLTGINLAGKGEQYVAYSVQGLEAGQYKLKVSNINGKVSFEGFKALGQGTNSAQ